MRVLVTILLFSLVFVSCKKEYIDNPDRFKHGIFEIPAGKGYSKTIITRIDSLQIEEYTRTISISNDSIVTEKAIRHIDTLYITWKNNFAYYLQMKTPKKELDKDPIFVQINKVSDDSYDFTAKIGYSKFKQTGTLYIKK